MDYCLIVCHKRNLYLKLGENGSPITCSKKEAKVFTEKKARNILNRLPKFLNSMGFQIEPVIPSDNEEDNGSDMEETITTTIRSSKKKQNHKSKGKGEVIKNDSYQVPNNVMTWVERVESCNRLISDADKRKTELIECLSNVDKSLSNILHKIEFLPDMNASMGYMQYKELKICLRKRRMIKDEIYIIEIILAAKENKFPSSQKIQNGVKHLENRIFKVRETEEMDWLEKLCGGA